MMRRWLVALLLVVGATPVAAERLYTTVSNSTVQITSSFDGATLSLFGTIEPDEPGTALTGTYNVIAVITGPLQDRVTRFKTNEWGIWRNTDEVVFEHFPSFYAVVSSGRLDSIATEEFLSANAVRASDQARLAAGTDTPKAARFGEALVRLMEEDSHFRLREDGVRFLSDTAYAVNVTLPSDVANGPFIVHTMVLKDKQLVAERSDGFTVRKSGIENFVFVASRQQPLLYGIVCVLLALGTGWLAGVVFKR
jgi:uncharacterized protein (TIGR02186 family)